jgi:tripartite-type tricarboxylate transporter receptor subunit TctC
MTVGSQAIADVAGGQADATMNGMFATYPLVQGGKLKPLAVSSAKRTSAIPKARWAKVVKDANVKIE